MKYEVGDTVLLLHSREEGRIVEIINDEMVMVNVEGVEFPVFSDQIDFPYFERFSRRSGIKPPKKVYVDQVQSEKKKRPVHPPANGVRLSFFPVYDPASHEDLIQHFKLYLINQNDEDYYFKYETHYKDDNSFGVENLLTKRSDFYLHDIRQEDLNDISKFIFHFHLREKSKEKAERIEKIVRVKAKTFFHKIEEMKSRNVPSFSFDLFKNYPAKPVEGYVPLPEKKFSKPLRQVSVQPALAVVDIHIDRIIPNHSGMGNFEIMQTQLDYFEKYYRLAVMHMQPSLIVIHGVGTGKLRDEIHDRLKFRKEVKTFVNRYHPLYGFGATEIYFQY